MWEVAIFLSDVVVTTAFCCIVNTTCYAGGSEKL